MGSTRAEPEPVVSAASYARWRASTLGRITERVETRLVSALAGDLHDRRVLDVGTGDGTYAIAAALGGADVSALDPQAAMLARAAERAAARGVTLDLHEGRVEAMPFADASFDVVIAVTVLCFVPDPAHALREMARVLAPGGRLVLGELARYSSWAAERRVRGWLGARTWRRARFSSRRDLCGLARGAGLTVLDLRGAVFFPPSGLAARVMAPLDPTLSRLRAPGPAFLALAAVKPQASGAGSAAVGGTSRTSQLTSRSRSPATEPRKS